MDELTRFREEWKAEVRRRANQTQATSPSSAGTIVDGVLSNSSEPPRPSARIQAKPVTHASPFAGSSQLPKGLSLAVESYRLAIQYEQSGELDEALRLYRNAFRLDPHVDKAYRTEERRLELAAGSRTANLPAKKDTKVTVLEEDHVFSAKRGQKPKTVSSKHSGTDSLAKLISTFPHDLSFEPLIENEDVPLRVLPDEVLVLVLKRLDPLSIERFALLSRKARILSLDSTIWR